MDQQDVLYDFVNVNIFGGPKSYYGRRGRKRRFPPPYEEFENEDHLKFEPKKLSLFNHIFKRELYGLNERSVKDVVAKHLSTAVPAVLNQHELDLGQVNKVFAAKWVNDSRVVMGTKCNKILVKDVYTNDTIRIPTIKSSGKSEPASCPCGIHAISLNPSKTLLATGAEHTNDLGVYRLPSFDPVFIGEEGHTDWIFDLQWVDDEYCITGSRDSKLALWKIVDDDDNRLARDINSYITSSGPPPNFDYKIDKPEHASKVNNADKIRALAYNSNGMEMGVLSLNSRIHTWDVCSFQLKRSCKLPHPRETVCMAYDLSKNVYAIGSQSNVTLMDRDLKPVINIEAPKKGCGIRSVSFKENIVTIGTGLGTVLFYDMSAGKYLSCSCGVPRELSVGEGYLLRDHTWRDFFRDTDYYNAIYAHCYDDNGTRLFTAGGPLPAGLVGNYAGVWY